MLMEKSSRFDTGELKAQLIKNVGPERFKRYFYCLSRFINQKLSKSDFDKSCYRLIGRENLMLHNQIIRAILKNACSANVAPPVHEVGPRKAASTTGRSSAVVDDGNGHVTILPDNQGSVAPVWSNGLALPMSPRKGMLDIRDMKFRDRTSSLGPNGDLAPCDYQRSIQEERELPKQLGSDERLMIKKRTDIRCIAQGKDQSNVAFVEDGEEVEQESHLKFCRSSLLAPLGIPFCSASIGGACKSIPVSNVGCFDSAELSDTETLRRRMEQVAAVQGLGVTVECANTLNNMVDVYLKRLIRSCVELVRARSNDTSKYPVQKQQIHGKPINGLWSRNHLHTQSGSGHVEEQTGVHSVSVLDFKVAMELNPQQLGEDWPLLLEKISMEAFEK